MRRATWDVYVGAAGLTLLTNIGVAGLLALAIPLRYVGLPDGLALGWFFWGVVVAFPNVIVSGIAFTRWLRRRKERVARRLDAPSTEPLWKASPDRLRQAWGEAQRDLARNTRISVFLTLLFGGAMLLYLLLTVPLLTRDIWELPMFVTVFLFALFLPILALVFLGSILAHLSDLTRAVREDRAIVRERRTRARDSELGGSLEVATSTNGGDLSIAVDAGALEVHQELVLDLETQREEVHVAAHQRTRGSS